MAFISILPSPPSIQSFRANVKVLNRLAKCVAIAGLLIGGARLSSAPSTGSERTVQRMNDQGVPVHDNPAGINEPQRSRGAPGLRNARPATRLAVGPAAVAWSGEL
jgi:hypothetical protein